MEEEILPFKVLETDKNIALVEMAIPIYKDGKEIELKLSSPGFQNSSYRIRKPEELNEKLIALDKEGITHRFISRFKTGSQPKSVRFIDNTRLAIPLLEDEGMDVLDINSGQTVRLSPPEKYKKNWVLWKRFRFRSTTNSGSVRCRRMRFTCSI